MGYTTNFQGSFAFNRPVEQKHVEYIKAFSETRRMKRNSVILEQFADPLRVAVDLPIGIDGEFFVNGVGFYGQGHDESVLNYNASPETQPGLWCQWIINGKHNTLEWNGGEKFYNYVDWLEYLIKNFFNPWGYYLNGKVEWQGEDEDDHGVIIVKSNNINLER
mgnify:CR=1 FL=1